MPSQKFVFFVNMAWNANALISAVGDSIPRVGTTKENENQIITSRRKKRSVVDIIPSSVSPWPRYERQCSRGIPR